MTRLRALPRRVSDPSFHPSMTRRPTFWIAFALLGLAGAATAIRLFSVALPSISVDITMDREATITEAAALAERYDWAPREARSAASFGQVDSEVQTYVELEGGGRDAFTGLAEANIYQPYQWRVRRFAERRIEESLVRFTPQGSPYGFELRLAEDDPGGGNLDAASARGVAERTADEWAVDLSTFDLVESSSATVPSGRVDHTFVYQRTGVTLAEARFRLRVTVAGDRASELTHFVQVPEAFSRRYAEMRSTNDAIALVSQSIFIFVFVLLGAGVGSALLLRRRWIEWRAPLTWGGLTAMLFGLNTVNMLPLSWMGYDTALSATTFMLQQIAGGAAIAVLGTPLLAFFFMAGESLGRRAFPEHIQQWRAWAPEVAASNTVLGLTAAAYLLVGIELGYVVLFYLGTSRLEGWWSPADALVQPDLLATYVPWLQAVSISLFASLWEESVFRAVPIAGAALIGLRYGRKHVWVWSAVILQALVFAAGHANYPQQPPYARVVELFLPAVLWGAVYVQFGLLPTILTHFLYDLSLISGVLFASNAMFDQGVIVLVALVPLAVVVRARVRGRARSSPPEWAYNRAWLPPPRAHHVDGQSESGAPRVDAWREPGPAGGAGELGGARDHGGGSDQSGERDLGASDPGGARRLEPTLWRVLPPAWSVYAAGAVGAALWLAAHVAGPPPPTLGTARSEAVATATAELRARGLADSRWSVLASASSGRSLAHEYVYEAAGPDAYHALTGSYLAGPRWIVRFVDWNAEPAERVEELRVLVDSAGQVIRTIHTLPEARAGSTLPVEEARARALQAVAEQFGLQPDELTEIEADETRRPNRTDWLFTFADPRALAEAEGQARVSVRVAGDRAVEARRFVHVPEEWEREWREDSSRRTIVTGGVALLLALCFGAFAVTGIVVWSRSGLPMTSVRRLGALTLVAMLASNLNQWPTIAATLSTAQPWAFQAGAVAVGLVLVAVVAAVAVGLAGALAHAWLGAGPTDRTPAGSAVALGLLLVGLSAVAEILASAPPPSPELAGAAAFVPWLSAPLETAASYLIGTTALLALVASYRRFHHRRVLSAIFWAVIIAGAVVAVPDTLRDSVAIWGLGAVAAGVLIVGILRLCAAQTSLVPVMVGTVLAADAVASAIAGPYHGATIGGLLAAGLVVGIALRWNRLVTPAL